MRRGSLWSYPFWSYPCSVLVLHVPVLTSPRLDTQNKAAHHSMIPVVLLCWDALTRWVPRGGSPRSNRPRRSRYCVGEAPARALHAELDVLSDGFVDLFALSAPRRPETDGPGRGTGGWVVLSWLAPKIGSKRVWCWAELCVLNVPPKLQHRSGRKSNGVHVRWTCGDSRRSTGFTPCLICLS